jgi:hypothetical protein
MGINFQNLHDLAEKLFRKPMNTPGHVCARPLADGKCPALAKGQIERLAINAHGLTGGQVFVNGKNEKPLSLKTIQEFQADLEAIGRAIDESGIVLFMGCIAGMFREGSQFIIELSKLWPGRRVAAFQVIGFAQGGPISRSGAKCTEPGMHTAAGP